MFPFRYNSTSHRSYILLTRGLDARIVDPATGDYASVAINSGPGSDALLLYARAVDVDGDGGFDLLCESNSNAVSVAPGVNSTFQNPYRVSTDRDGSGVWDVSAIDDTIRLVSGLDRTHVEVCVALREHPLSLSDCYTLDMVDGPVGGDGWSAELIQGTPSGGLWILHSHPDDIALLHHISPNAAGRWSWENRVLMAELEGWTKPSLMSELQEDGTLYVGSTADGTVLIVSEYLECPTTGTVDSTSTQLASMGRSTTPVPMAPPNTRGATPAPTTKDDTETAIDGEGSVWLVVVLLVLLVGCGAVMLVAARRRARQQRGRGKPRAVVTGSDDPFVAKRGLDGSSNPSSDYGLLPIIDDHGRSQSGSRSRSRRSSGIVKRAKLEYSGMPEGTVGNYGLSGTSDTSGKGVASEYSTMPGRAAPSSPYTFMPGQEAKYTAMPEQPESSDYALMALGDASRRFHAYGGAEAVS